MDNRADKGAATIGFQIREIRVGTFTINENLLNEGDTIGFGVTIQHLFNSELNEQVVRVELEAGHKQEESPLVILHLDCYYQLTGYTDWLHEQAETHRIPGTLPPGLAVTLNSISISTTRGVLFERLRVAGLPNVILPIIDPSAFQPVS